MPFDFFGRDRARFLDLAVKDTLKWCASPNETVGRKPSDQYWMALLDTRSGIPINEKHAHSFLVTFQLTNRVIWDKPLVARIIEELRQSADFDPKIAIPALALRLRDANFRKSRQTSAASKLSNFAHPRSDIFIWDNLASRSARFRDWARSGCPGKSSSKTVYLDRAGNHDYSAFHEACRLIFNEECAKEDFSRAADQLIEKLRRRTGPISDTATVPDTFIKRRLLDKLMFWEGWTLKYPASPFPGDIAQPVGLSASPATVSQSV